MEKNENIKEAEIILENLDKKSEVCKDIDPMASLRQDLLVFLQDTITHITTQELAKGKVLKALLDKVDESELDFTQLAKLYSMFSNEKNISTNTLLSLFIPQGREGTISPLASSLTSSADSTSAQIFKSDELSEDDIKALEYLSRMMPKLMEESKKVE